MRLLLWALSMIGAWAMGLSHAVAGVITQLPTQDKLIALTFDACEAKTPAHFDAKVVSFLLSEKLPVTIFASGNFARHNGTEIEAMARDNLIEIENHSLNHLLHMEALKPAKLTQEVTETSSILQSLTGKPPHFFRFPAGNYNAKALQQVENLGYKVVHWSFASGDPDKSISAKRLTRWVLTKTKPGSILIFHINGRGYHTGEVLPIVIAKLKQAGYRFARLDEML